MAAEHDQRNKKLQQRKVCENYQNHPEEEKTESANIVTNDTESFLWKINLMKKKKNRKPQYASNVYNKLDKNG